MTSFGSKPSVDPVIKEYFTTAVGAATCKKRLQVPTVDPTIKDCLMVRIHRDLGTAA